MGYVDPAGIHNPASGTVAPASWGDAVNAALAWLANPDQVKVARSSNQSIPDTTLTAVAWNAEEWDSDGLHSLVSSTENVVVKTAGKYLVLASVVFDSDGTGASKRAELWKGSTGSGVKLNDASMITTGFARLNLHAEVECVVGDVLSVHVSQVSGGALSVLGGSAGTSVRSWMSARWIGS